MLSHLYAFSDRKIQLEMYMCQYNSGIKTLMQEIYDGVYFANTLNNNI